MSRLLVICVLSLIAGCGNNEQSKTLSIEEKQNNIQEINQNSTKNPTVSKINGKNDQSFELDEQFNEYIEKMNKWKSFESSFDYKEIYQDKESSTDSELYIEKKYVVSPAQVYKNTHRLAFTNYHLEQYAHEYDGGFQNENMNNWEVFDDKSILKNPIPAKVELLQALIASAEELVTTEDFNSPVVAHLIIREEELLNIYKKIQIATFYNITDNEVTQETLNAIEEIIDLDSIYALIFIENNTIVGYELSINFNQLNNEKTDQYLIQEMFKNINTFTKIDIPNEVKENL